MTTILLIFIFAACGVLGCLSLWAAYLALQVRRRLQGALYLLVGLLAAAVAHTAWLLP